MLPSRSNGLFFLLRFGNLLVLLLLLSQFFLGDLNPGVVIGANDEVAEGKKDGPSFRKNEFLGKHHEEGACDHRCGADSDKVGLQGGGNGGEEQFGQFFYFQQHREIFDSPLVLEGF